MNMLKLFGTSGIRGKSILEITRKLAFRIGLTFAAFMENNGTIIVGRDVRLTAKELSKAVISGALKGGLNIQDCDVAPTPAILWALKKKKLDGAIVVTGSHAPKDIIGFLFFLADTSEFSEEDALVFENLFYSSDRKKYVGSKGRKTKIDISDLYCDSVLEQINFNKVSSFDAKVVLDPGNGASASYCSKIFNKANVKTEIVNSIPDGLFPNRDPYPRPENLGSLSRKVKEINANFGCATDCDGDRAIFVDDSGRILWGDVSASIFVRDILKEFNGGVIVAPVNSSRLINYVCDNYNGRLHFSKIGPPAIVSAMKKENAVMGVEETGKNIWADKILYGDWILSIIKMIEILSEENISLFDLANIFPEKFLRKLSFSCPNSLKQVILDHAVQIMSNSKEDMEMITVDGLRINYRDGSWLLFRPSGTESVFRLYAESESEKRTANLIGLGTKIIKQVL